MCMHLMGHNISIYREKRWLYYLPVNSVGTAFLAELTLKFLPDVYL